MSKGIIEALMITPFLASQRGNSLTAFRIREGLEKRGVLIDTVSLDTPEWETRVKNALLEKRYDLIHGFHGIYMGQVLSRCELFGRAPLLLTITGTDLNQKKNGEEENALKAALSTARRVVVFNDDLRYRLVSRYSGTVEKTSTIPQGVFLKAGRRFSRAELGLKEDEIVFFLPSGLREVKNLEMAISGLEMARETNPGIRLLIVGTAIEKDYTEIILGSLKEKPWASYLGEVPHSWMYGLMRISDVVLNTSRSEGQPQGAIETMSLGKPSILTLVPGNRGVMRHRVDGFYVDDVEDLAIAADDLAGSKRLRILMGTQAREMVAARFSLEREIEAYACIYEELASVKP